MTVGPSLTARAVLAVALLVGFYALALGLAGLLLYLPYAELVYAHRVHPKLVIIGLVGAGAILYGIVPRRARFTPPGPLLSAEAQPLLHALVDEIARQTDQAPPVEIYLVPDVNAWVTQRGGFMGFGGRRVMGVGLPLMQALNVSQLRAVLAHEFGHYHGGDTALGPWIYATRGAIERTVASLGATRSFLQIPFVWYGKLFLRTTLAVSRAQEYAADALAVQIAGRSAMVGGLKGVHGAAIGFQLFLNSELQPVLGAGFRPPVATGFASFLAADQISAVLTRAVATALSEGEADPYDSHPSLKARVAALEAIPRDHATQDTRASTCLLRDIPSLEADLIASLMGPRAATLKTVDWSEVGDEVIGPRWVRLAERCGPVLTGINTDDLPAAVATRERLGRRLAERMEQRMKPEDQADFALQILAAAMVAAGRRRGCSVESLPGQPVRLRLAGASLAPLDALRALSQGRLDAAGWMAACAAVGVNGVDLGNT